VQARPLRLDPERGRRVLGGSLGVGGPPQDRPAEQRDQRPPGSRLDHVGVEQFLVEPFAAPEVGDATAAVVVVRDEEEERPVVLAPALDVEGQVEWGPRPAEGRLYEAAERDQPVLGPPLGIVDEGRVDPQRDVVQEEKVVDGPDVDPALLARLERRDRIVDVEARVAGEVVPRAERDGQERDVRRDRLRRDGRK